MKSILALLLMCCSFASLAQTVNPLYDSTMAKTLGADEYGMKKYVLVILKTGSNTTDDKLLRDRLFAGHMENIDRLVKLNKLIVAGPIAKNEKSYRGIFILQTATFEEAAELLKADAAIAEKLLEPEFYYWFGSAALPEYLKVADTIWKSKP